MIPWRFRSLQVRLAVRLAILYVVATAAIVGVLIYRAYDTAGSLNERELSLRAADLARHITVGSDGRAILQLPATLAAEYDSTNDTDIFAIRGVNGLVIAALPQSFGALTKRWPAPTDDPSFFHLKDFGSKSQDYYGLSISEDSAAGPVSISVARASGADMLVHSLLREFIVDIAWIIPLVVIVKLVIAVLVIRSGLWSVRQVSAMAAGIGPSTTSVRLPEESLPSEVTPLVAAVNRAFDRLAEGFAVQRQFTAHAAHELRTPLAIITAAMDAMEGGEELTKLRRDVARMNRLVEQLLRVARLDAIALDVSDTVDLNDVAASVVAAMAPWVLTQCRTLAFAEAKTPVCIRGNANAIEDAVRNLVENAVAHSPAGTEVTVATKPEGSISVADRGSGIRVDERERIFERFWRGKNAIGHGAGLGLAIVKEVIKAHQGSVGIGAHPEGGAIFTLSFPPVERFDGAATRTSTPNESS
jgi:two-component system, OmpR family, sensor histidine kinase TctE